MPFMFPAAFNRISLGAIGLAVATSVVGCVPAEQYEAMKMKADQYAEQLGRSESELASAKMRGDVLEKQMASMNNVNSDTAGMVANTNAQLEEARKRNDELNQQYTQAMLLASRAGQPQALPTGLNDQLKEFAASNPDLIDFDPAHGVVKFKSDVTFATGDTTVTPAAKAILQKFATILGSGEHYELLVAGHTDDTPVTNPLTIQKGNFDNWYLSSHRAIAVGKELISDGVSAKRVGMVGYADQRPVSPGASKAANRRVEVLILPTVARSSGYASKPKKQPAFAPSTPIPAGATFNKDGGAPSAPVAPAQPAPVVPLTK